VADPVSLRGMRVLIVEDTFVVADGLKFLIESYQGSVVAMAPNLERAFEELAAVDVDVAVLDINLNGTSVVPLAEHLQAHGIQFLFLSGYGDPELLPEHMRGCPRLDKPVDAQRLLQALSELVAKPNPASDDPTS
jgi:YesN/AraC family two-component response regulator